MKLSSKISALLAILAAAAMVSGCGSDSKKKDDPIVTPPPPPPPAPTTVVGSIGTTAAALDQFASVALVPATGDAIELPVASDGTFSAQVPAGAYTVLAGRPGYEGAEVPGFTVVANQQNTLTLTLAALPKMTYIGSPDCGSCHTAYFESFMQSGHPFKFTKVEGNQAPFLPFTPAEDLDSALARVAGAVNTLGAPQGWDETTYLIGGFHWKARWLDADGFRVTGTEVQWNMELDRMIAYNATSVDQQFNCGNCHATGWKPYDDSLNPNRQDDLRGMGGTFAFTGIQCEACHGAGAGHAQTGLAADITTKAQPRTLAQLEAPDQAYGLPVACGECHSRDSERNNRGGYPSAFDKARDAAGLPRVAQGGRIIAATGTVGGVSVTLANHHEQIEEIWSFDPDTLASTRSGSFLGTHGDCSTCHNPHGSTVKKDEPGYTGMPGVDSTKAACLTCHGLFDPELRDGGMKGLECIDCHMPKLVRTAERYAPVGEGPGTGDIRTHVFKINMGLDQEVPPPQFTEDKAFQYPYITTDYACRTCHNGVDYFAVPDDLLPAFGFTKFHNNLPSN
jgi:hypothetical protein